jgi:hypothetical protein
VDARYPAYRWHPRGPFAAIRDEPTQRNVDGRARLDSDGRLHASPRTLRVASADEADGYDFVCAERVMSDADCARVVAAFEALRERVVRNDPVDPYWSGRYLWANEMVTTHADVVAIMREATHRARRFVEAFYRLDRPLYNDIFQLVQWPVGQFMRPHADRANPDGRPHGMPYRHFAGILYLNDDYEGGELYFTAQDIVLKPRRGMFVGFTGGFHHEHAVTRVESGAVRMTMPSFYSFEAQHADALLHPEAARG